MRTVVRQGFRWVNFQPAGWVNFTPALTLLEIGTVATLIVQYAGLTLFISKMSASVPYSLREKRRSADAGHENDYRLPHYTL